MASEGGGGLPEDYEKKPFTEEEIAEFREAFSLFDKVSSYIV